MLQGIDTRALTELGRFRAAVQTPGERTRRRATITDTYPPWDADRSDVEQLKQRQTTIDSTGGVEITPSLGRGPNSGEKRHKNLLLTAQETLEDRGFQVNLLYQQTGEEKPDGYVQLSDEATAHLEAECTSLSKPGRVLTNYRRAIQQDRMCIFVVEAGNRDKLEAILQDPVNRQGESHEDDTGSYDYYRVDGEPVTAVEPLRHGEYRILEISADKLPADDPDCPQMGVVDREDLEFFCTFRDTDGRCTELDQPCVLHPDHD